MKDYLKALAFAILACSMSYGCTLDTVADLGVECKNLQSIAMGSWKCINSDSPHMRCENCSVADKNQCDTYINKGAFESNRCPKGFICLQDEESGNICTLSAEESCNLDCTQTGRVCVNGNCECPDGKAFCNDECIDLNTNDSCGTCDNHPACSDGLICVEGRCEGKCGDNCEKTGGRCENGYCKCPNEDMVLCSDGCIKLNSNDSCGTCDKHSACLDDRICINGKCECADGKTLCNNECIDLNSDEDCGTCEDHHACTGDTICINHECKKNKVKSCTNSDDSNESTLCWKSSETNICTNPKTDNNRCGCGGSENDPQPGIDCISLIEKNNVLSSTCINGNCKLTCDEGFADCDSDALNGCETDLNHDLNNCQQCGHKCNADQICSNGICQCPEGHTDCDGQCHDLKDDDNNCGSCNHNCSDDMICKEGECTCKNSLLTLCNDHCENFNLNEACGTCQSHPACENDNVCINHKCTQPSLVKSCQDSQTMCFINPAFSLCISDPNTNNMYCGCGGSIEDPKPGKDCNTISVPDNMISTCVDGSCITKCIDGYYDCDNDQSNGCEINLKSDPNNCGECGKKIESVSGSHTMGLKCLNGMPAFTCEPGFGDCNNNLSDGCELEFSKVNENDNCGECGKKCKGAGICVNGECRCNPSNTYSCGCGDESDGIDCEAIDHVKEVSCIQGANGKYRCNVTNCSALYSRCVNKCVYWTSACDICETDDDCSVNVSKNKCCPKENSEYGECKKRC